jgi:hypothetical protein
MRDGFGPAATDALTSRTSARDESTKKSGSIWVGDVHVLGTSRFTFVQYAKNGNGRRDKPLTFLLCPKS